MADTHTETGRQTDIGLSSFPKDELSAFIVSVLRPARWLARIKVRFLKQLPPRTSLDAWYVKGIDAERVGFEVDVKTALAWAADRAAEAAKEVGPEVGGFVAVM